MPTQHIQTIAITGAGTMGAGIALVCAQANRQVILFDLQDSVLDKAKINNQKILQKQVDAGKLAVEQMHSILDQIVYTTDVNQVKAELIIEAIVEKLPIKQGLFKQLMEINGADCIYATNTSSIPITQIAAGLAFPEQVIGIHFFNPAHIMKLVEVIKGAKTNSTIVERVLAFVQSIGKTGVVAADAPGFIVNRIARLYYVESLKLLEEGVADIETIDRIMESSGFKMGPFKLMDLIGVDTNYSVTESQYQLFNFEPRFRPSRIQKQKVDAGLHGRKTKAGFYNYDQ
jgi:3-hydroxybutyryl-CoA dehydrogenase